MKTKQLRKRFQKFNKWPKCKIINKAPVIHKGFPSCFNLSFGEYELIHEFGQYLHFSKDFTYSKIQPCIRHQDWPTILNEPKNAWRYLSVFDMADIPGLIILKDAKYQEESAKFAIKSFLDFLEKIGLDKKQLVISYFKESSVKEATAGKYTFNKIIPTDPMLSYWKKLGIKEKQLLPDQTRDTLLSLRVFGLPTAWGYRNEIHYKYNKTLLDIGTVEYMKYEPIIKNSEIIGLKDYEHTVSVAAMGFERILMVLNNKKDVIEIDSIKPLYDIILKLAKNKKEAQAKIVTQAIRVIHRIIADGGKYSELNKRRKEYMRDFYRPLFLSMDILEIEKTEKNFKKMLKTNAKIQKHYPELTKCITFAINEINNKVMTLGV